MAETSVTTRNFINNTWQDAGGGWLAVEDPATETVTGHAARSGAAEIDAAVRAAREVADRRLLADMDPMARAALMRATAEAIEAKRDAWAPVLCRESGKPLSDAAGEFDEAAAYFRYYGGLADKLEGRAIPLGQGYVDYTIREPYGVSAQIVPWNFPVGLTGRGLAPALAAGNAVVVKTPELDPLAATALAEACYEAGWPAGAVNLVSGYGGEAGQALLDHPGTDQYVFTGSVGTGQRVMQAAAESIKPAVIELGGKSAGIVRRDADLEHLAAAVKTGTFFNSGQVCSALSRLVVPRERQTAVVDRLGQMMASLKLGDGFSEADVTPLIASGQLDRVEAMCQDGRKAGASLAVGGERAGGNQGHYMAPTLAVADDPGNPLVQEEVFGPVLTVQPYDSEDEAVQLANGTRYGLCAGVFTADLGAAQALAPRLVGGQVFVNEWFVGGVQTPFGGMKGSGFGREKGQEALANYLQTKNVGIKL